MDRKPRRRLDLNQLAASIVRDATEEPPPADEEKGGKARAKKLTPERRKEIAQHAAAKRWGKEG